MAHAYDPHSTSLTAEIPDGGTKTTASRVEIDWTTPDAVSTAVVDALSKATGRSPMDIGPVYDDVDLEALTHFLSHRRERNEASETSATFTVDGLTVAVNGREVVVSKS